MPLFMKRTMYVAVIALIGLAFGRAASLKFQDRIRAINEQCRAELQKLGISRGAAKAKYFTPEIGMVTAACIPPGGTGQVIIRGRFAPGTKFIFENDNIDVVTENLAGGEYRATLKAAPGIGPQTAGVSAITPVTGLTVRRDRVALVGGKYEWALDTANGWRVLARSNGPGCSEQSEAAYDMQFFRKGESAPFEERSAKLYYSVYDRENFNFRISEQDAKTDAQRQDMQALMQRMADPKLTDAQREQLVRKIQDAQQQMMAGLKKMADPNYAKQLQAQRDQFGCEHMWLEETGGNLKGRLVCSEKVGRQIGLTGAVKYVGR